MILKRISKAARVDSICGEERAATAQATLRCHGDCAEWIVPGRAWRVPVYRRGGCSAWSRREPGLRLLCGTSEGVSRYCHWMRWREGGSLTGDTRTDGVPMWGALAD